MTPERKARVEVDALLVAEGTHVCDMAQASIHPATALDIRELPLARGFGFVDYLLYFKGMACGIVEASKQGTILSGVEPQSSRYAEGLPTRLLAWSRPLRFMWVPAVVVFVLFRAALLVQWLTCLSAQATSIAPQETSGTFLARVQQIPLPFLSLERQIRIVFDVGRNLSMVSKVEADVVANLKRAAGPVAVASWTSAS